MGIKFELSFTDTVILHPNGSFLHWLKWGFGNPILLRRATEFYSTGETYHGC